MKRIYSVTLCLLTLVLFSCTSNDPTMPDDADTGGQVVKPDNPSPDPTPAPTSEMRKISLSAGQQALVDRFNSNALATFKTLSDGSTDNLLFSPASLLQNLAMTANGAKGETLAQLLTYTGATDLQELNALCSALHKQLPGVDESFCTYIDSNSAWVNTGASLSPSYTNALSQGFDAEIFKCNLSSEKYVTDVNAWISKKTNGLLKDVVKEPLKEATLSLANTVYFSGQWNNAFIEEATRNRQFKNANGSQTNTSFMHCHDAKYVAINGGQAVSLDYGQRALSFLATDIDIADSEIFNNINNGLNNNMYLLLGLPKFDISAEAGQITKALRANGVTNLWNKDLCDLSGTGIKDAYMNTLIHSVRVSIDEKGTKAAAASINFMCGSTGNEPEYTEVIFDHPFTFVIRENSTGLILFMGRINKL